ncbi:MAG: hemolysin family protein [Candidatus Omnitrophica bacterium]|nr:hemolysin family protein [Candidatus Omnitrophota bacterium]
MFITEYILGILVGVVLCAFFAGSEAALTAVNKIRLRHLSESGDRRAKEAVKFIANKPAFLGTTLIGTNISVVISSALATKILTDIFGIQNGPVVSTIIVTFFMLIFGEIIPKTLFRQASDAMSLKIIYPLKFIYKLLTPLLWIINGITNIVFFPFRDKLKKGNKVFMSKSDIELVFSSSKQKEVVTHDENVLIQRIFDLGRTSIRKIIIPWTKTVLLNVDNTITVFEDVARKTKFSRFPVYENDPNNIIGTVNIYDHIFNNEPKNDLRGYVNKPFFVKQTDHIDDTLHNMRKNKVIMAIVVNNLNMPVGIVTIEDLLEEIVGEIEG